MSAISLNPPIIMETPQVITPICSLVAEEQSQEPDQEQSLSLPKEKNWQSAGYFAPYQGFWYTSTTIPNIISFQKHFQAHDDDIIVATKPKSGTTWLKALVFSILNRTRFTPSNSPLLTSNPHDLVPFFELTLYVKNQLPDLATIPSPRLFATHMPYAPLPESIKQSNCRIVYMCRNPFDLIVSCLHFVTPNRSEVSFERSMEELFEMFCRGEDWFGPFWEHMLGYWKESLEKPDKVLFLKYEDLKKDSVFHLKRLAEFIGFPFSLVEEKEGVIEEISKLCSFTNLKDLEVNKTGKTYHTVTFDNKSFFRKGEIGDYRNYLTPSMVEHLDKLIQEKFSGSGLSFQVIQ